MLKEVYRCIAISVPPGADPKEYACSANEYSVVVCPDWARGRHLALKGALEFNVNYIHYVDLDRLLHWIEIRPAEWRQICKRVEATDCLIVGRTARAYATHPQALIQTEKISNAVVSHFLGRTVDASAGSRGFSRRAAEYLMAHSDPGRALGMDAEWPILLLQAGFSVDYDVADGLEWESADRHREHAADKEEMRQAAAVYDADPQHWAMRVAVATEIVQSALQAAQRKTP